MGSKSQIEWTDATWNPVRGCTRVSPGCQHCYAERFAARRLPGHKSPTTGEPFAIMRNGEPHWTGKVELIESALELPLHWKEPRRIFVNSMSDLFHEDLADHQLLRVFGVMRRAHWHTYQVLTKRHHRMNSRIPWIRQYYDLPNVWLGVSVEDQQRANERIPLLLQTPAAVRFVSAEPLLGPVDLKGWTIDELYKRAFGVGKVDWVVCGGESGPHARPIDPDWVRSLRDQCIAAGVPFFFKQWGGANKKRAGSWLDGREWNEMPQAALEIIGATK